MTVQDELSCMVQDVKVSILTNLECVHVQLNRYKSAMVTENMMCAGYPDDGKDSCQVIYRHFQIKIYLHFKNSIWTMIVFQ